MAAGRRYYSDDDHIGKTPSALKRLGRARQGEYLLYWFHRNFEDPVEETPWESAEGGYQYIWGGPYDANDELQSEFGGIVPYEVIEAAVREVEENGVVEWAPGPDHPDTRRQREEALAEDLERSTEPPRRWPTHGVIMAPLTVGGSVGKPLNEPAHITPRFPGGIKDSDLQQADDIIQRETAMWWFLLNLEPYDRSRAGARYGEARFGDPFSRPAVKAKTILRQEFAGVLPDAIIDELGDILAGDWMWKRAPVRSLLAPPSTASEAMTAVVPVLEALTIILEDLARPAVHGGIGHNRPPEDYALTEQDRQAVLEKIDEATQVAKSNEPTAPSKLVKLWEGIRPTLAGIGKWSLDRVNEFASEAFKEAGRTATKGLVACLVAHATICSLVTAADQIIAVLHQH